MNQVKLIGRRFLQGGMWLLIFGWILFIYGSSIYFQRGGILWGSLGETLLRIFLLLVFLLVSAGLGRKIFKRLRFESGSFLESFLFGLAMGLAIITYAVIGFGLAGFLNRWVINLFFVGMFVLTYDEIGNIINEIKTKFKALATPKIPFIEIVLLLVLALQVLFNLTGASVLPSGWDSLAEHLAKAKEWNRLHRLASIPYINYSQWGQPFNVGILYGMALFLKDAILAQLIHFAFGLLTAVGVYALGKRYFSHRVGLISATIFYTVPIVAYMSTTAYVDLGLTFYTFFAFYALIRWVSSGRKGWLVLSAIISGLGLGSKYGGLPFIFILSSGILLGGWLVRKEKFGRVIADFFIFLGLGGLIGSFWYVRAYFIEAYGVFTTLQDLLFWFWRAIKGIWASGVLNLEISQPAFALDISLPKKIMSLSWNVSMHAGRFHGYGIIGIVFLAFLPLFLFPRFRRSRLIKFVFFYSAAYFILWATLASDKRYLVPILPLSGIMIGYIIEQIPSFNRFFKRFFYLVLILTFLFQVVYLAPNGLGGAFQRMLVFAGLKSQEEYILTREETYAVFKYINENSLPGTKVWILNDPRVFYCDYPHVNFVEFGAVYGAERMLVKLKRAGITHLVFNQYLWRYSQGDRQKYPTVVNVLKPEYLRTVYEKYPFIIWKLSYPESSYWKLFAKVSLSVDLQTAPKSFPSVWNAQDKCLNMYWSGDISSEIFLFPKGGYEVEVVARGTPLQEIYPRMSVLWEGEKDEQIDIFSVSQKWKGYVTRAFNIDSPTLGCVSVAFTNDASGGEEDRNLYIKEIIIRKVDMDGGEKEVDFSEDSS